MRYFISTLNHIHDLEQEIQKKETDPIFQVVIRESSHIKRFTWNLIRLDIHFKRSPLGSGVTIFYVNTQQKYF